MRSRHSLDFSLVLASSVHDMKNSLSMLLSSLESVIEDTPPRDSQQAKQFAILQYEASRINSELIQLLSIYNMQQSRLPLRIDESFPIDTIEEQVARNDMLFKTRNIKIDIECDQDLVWYYDNDLIGNVIHNVMINASRYTKDQMKISASIEDEYLVLTVADNGGGFPSFMLDPSAVMEKPKETDSTQLGLFFASTVASYHTQGSREGYIRLANGGELGGSIFSIYLP